MSCTIAIRLPGLTAERAEALDRQADIAGLPFEFAGERRSRGSRSRAGREPVVVMRDLREDPSVASESLDFPDGWPSAPEVREWLAEALRFLGEVAPSGCFSFSAGWDDRRVPVAPIELALEQFVATIRAGGLRSDQRYDVHRS